MLNQEEADILLRTGIQEVIGLSYYKMTHTFGSFFNRHVLSKFLLKKRHL